MTTPPRGMFVTRLTCQEPDCTAELQEWPGSEPLRAKERGWRETFGYWRCPQHATGTAPSAVPPRAHVTRVTAIVTFEANGVLHRAVWLKAVPPHQPTEVVIERSETDATGTPRWAHWTRYNAELDQVLMALLCRLYPTPAKVVVTE